jgi:hypothetical protein
VLLALLLVLLVFGVAGGVAINHTLFLVVVLAVVLIALDHRRVH